MSDYETVNMQIEEFSIDMKRACRAVECCIDYSLDEMRLNIQTLILEMKEVLGNIMELYR
jgi:hypothetical protein